MFSYLHIYGKITIHDAVSASEPNEVKIVVERIQYYHPSVELKLVLAESAQFGAESEARIKARVVDLHLNHPAYEEFGFSIGVDDSVQAPTTSTRVLTVNYGPIIGESLDAFQDYIDNLAEQLALALFVLVDLVSYRVSFTGRRNEVKTPH